MTNSNNKQAVAVKTRVNAGPGCIQWNHNETVVVKTQVSAGTMNWGGIIAVL
jgi:hypothetical protein